MAALTLCSALQWADSWAGNAMSARAAKDSMMTTPADAPPAKTSSRGRAPAVPAVDLAGIRYEPLQAASSEGLPLGIYIKATDLKSSRRLWTTKVWDSTIDANREVDVQTVFIRSLTLDATTGLLRVEDETGRQALVDVKDGQVQSTRQGPMATASRLSSPEVPPEIAPASPAAKPKPTLSAKRVGPPSVDALVVGNVRYEAVHWGRARGLPQNGGYIAALDVNTEQELWIAQVYVVTYQPRLETDVQDIFITAMALSPDGRALLISNEAGRHFVLNLADRIVTESP